METPIQRLEVSAYTVPTDVPESDGTYTWDSTTLVLVEVTAGNVQGLGYTYADMGALDDSYAPIFSCRYRGNT